MRRDILMPTLSEEAEEGVVVTWFVVPGAAVREGDRVAEVQVEKVSAEVYAPTDGRVAEILVAQGEVVRQGVSIGTIEVGAEAEVGPEEVAPAPAVAAPPAGPPPPASPSARRLARELGVDLATVAGSGPQGRIIEADVQAAAGAPAARPPGAPAAIPLTPMRRTIAQRLTTGLATAAQLTLTAEVDATALADEIERLGAEWARRVSFTEAIVRACALAIPRHPLIASRLEEEGLVPPGAIDIGVAVAVEGGLVAPVVRAADTKGLDALGREIAELAERARAARLEAAEMEGAVFSVTSLGGYRIDAFTPLLDPPQTGILGVGRARLRPAVVDGEVVPRRLMVLSLTFDHRVIDGAPAAAFLQEVAEILEDPPRLT
jgi:pyruvate dehydrogenase E2 component (dihydrolipoamide acetyltransferase)